MVIGWVAPAAFRLCTSDTPLVTGPLTNEQLSWLGSINCVGALCGAFSYGYFTTVIGSKLVVLLSAIPIVSFWILIAFGDLYEYLLIARFIGGFAGGGIQVTIMLYVSEIANDEWVYRVMIIKPILKWQYTCILSPFLVFAVA